MAAICQRCGNKWRYGMVASQIFKKRKRCPHCGITQYASYKTAKRMMIFMFLIPILFIFLRFFNVDNHIIFVVTTVWLLLFIIITPIMTQLTNDEDHPL